MLETERRAVAGSGCQSVNSLVTQVVLSCWYYFIVYYFRRMILKY